MAGWLRCCMDAVCMIVVHMYCMLSVLSCSQGTILVAARLQHLHCSSSSCSLWWLLAWWVRQGVLCM